MQYYVLIVVGYHIFWCPTMMMIIVVVQVIIILCRLFVCVPCCCTHTTDHHHHHHYCVVMMSLREELSSSPAYRTILSCCTIVHSFIQSTEIPISRVEVGRWNLPESWYDANAILVSNRVSDKFIISLIFVRLEIGYMDTKLFITELCKMFSDRHRTGYYQCASQWTSRVSSRGAVSCSHSAICTRTLLRYDTCLSDDWISQVRWTVEFDIPKSMNLVPYCVVRDV